MGVAILVNKQFKYIKESADTSGRFVSVLAEIQGQTMILACAYMPCVNDPDYYTTILLL